MKSINLIFKLFLFSLVFVSCNEDDEQIKEVLVLDINSKDFVISGEGSGAGTGSVSYVSSDFKKVENNIYQRINGDLQFGTFLQSLCFDADNAYVIVDNANTITVVDNSTFIKVNEITTGLITPRFMTIYNGKGYVTNWGSTTSETDDFIAVVDLTNNTVDKTITVANGPEQIVAKNGKLYVSHKGAFGVNDIVSVIDIATETVSTITVKEKPDELFFNNDGDLVVLSEGNIVYNSWPTIESETKGAIQTIDVETNTVLRTLDFPDSKHPSLMTQSNGKIYYYVSGEVYELATDATTLPTTSVLSTSLSGMLVDNGNLYGVNASYTAQSDFKVFDLVTKAETYTAKVALGATKIYFTE